MYPCLMVFASIRCLIVIQSEAKDLLMLAQSHVIQSVAKDLLMLAHVYVILSDRNKAVRHKALEIPRVLGMTA